MNQQKIAQEHIASYQSAIKKNGISLKSLYWPTYKIAARRYKELLNDLQLEGRKILDVGCGMGDLIPYIIAKTNQFNYRGIDLMPEFISEAQKRFPGKEFEFAVNDFWSPESKETADIIITCGTLNFAILDVEKRKKMIKKLFECAGEALVFNMSGNYPKPKLSKEKSFIGYEDALEILNYCFTLTPKLVFRHHYHPLDFTIVLFHQEFQSISRLTSN